eukprot:TRINITY_DN1142_c0_g1_i9.p1 TRINITY_DN1142_c0_g1~~TRINITY_DN1142_c0_g1_i9.p1  ORF type:complete len:132 (-),score=32.08 TRINITY_DN1142_c0_g1_i9:218-613(-)
MTSKQKQKEIKESVSKQILKMGMEVPYLNSSYGSRKDAELSFMKIEHILNQLNSIRNVLGPIQPPLNTTPPVFSPSPSPININAMQTSPISDSNQINTEEIFEDGMGESENPFQVESEEGMDFENVELNIQ